MCLCITAIWVISVCTQCITKDSVLFKNLILSVVLYEMTLQVSKVSVLALVSNVFQIHFFWRSFSHWNLCFYLSMFITSHVISFFKFLSYAWFQYSLSSTLYVQLLHKQLGRLHYNLIWSTHTWFLLIMTVKKI